MESYAPGTAPVAYCPLHSQLLGVPGMTPTTQQPRTVEVQGAMDARPDVRTGARADPIGPAAAIPGAATSGGPARPKPAQPPPASSPPARPTVP